MRTGAPAAGARQLRALGLCALALGGLYLAECRLARGIYNDDDIGHYLMARDAPRDPILYLNVWGRPLFTLVYSLPAQLGFDPVRHLTGLVTVASAVLTGLAGARLGIPLAIGAGLFGTMPFVLLLSYSSLTEPLAALVAAVALWAWLGGRRGLALVSLALLPLARLELSLIALPLGLVACARGRGAGRWLGLLPGALLFLWAAIGAWASGDLSFLPRQVLGGGENLYGQTGFWHYPRGLIFVVGPVVFLFLLVDLVERIVTRKLDLVAVIPAVVLGLYLVFSWRLSVGHAAGFLRHLVAAGPAFALAAGRGLQRALTVPVPRRILVTLGLGTLVIGVFLSRALVMHHRAVGPFEPTRLIAGILVLVVVLVGASRSRVVRFPRAALAFALVLVALGYAILAEPPLQPSAEQEAVLALADWFLASDAAGAPVIASHPWFLLALDRSGRTRAALPLTKRPAIDAALPGTVIIWDSHYAIRPPDGMTLRDFKFDPRFELLRESIAADRKFAAYALRKVRS